MRHYPNTKYSFVAFSSDTAFPANYLFEGIEKYLI
jgi:hypothetical protein